MVRTVYLNQGLESGTWMYTLPGANRISATQEEYSVTVRQRVTSNDKREEEATYEYHYIVLEDVDTDLEKEEVIALGFPEQAQLNVITGERDF